MYSPENYPRCNKCTLDGICSACGAEDTKEHESHYGDWWHEDLCMDMNDPESICALCDELISG